jgi:hypothetical protein
MDHAKQVKISPRTNSVTLQDRVQMTRPGILSQWGFRSIIVVVATALTMVTLGVGPASAEGNTDTKFTAQAQKVGLRTDQMEVLQARVEGYLAKSGGVQVGANEIQYADGSLLVLALPGESRARRLNPAVATGQSLYACPYEWFCVYQYTFFGGDIKMEWNCAYYVPVPWAGDGSYVNNQTSGTKAMFYRFGDWPHQDELIGYTYPASVTILSYNLTPVYWFKACGNP